MSCLNCIPSDKTYLTGILGKPLEHTLSPAMHMAAFEKVGLNCLFIPFPLEEHDIGTFLKALPCMRFLGLSVTMPYKNIVLPFMDELDISAQQCGSVNVIKVSGDKLIGYNTDGRGFVKGLIQKAGFLPMGRHCVILGSGGSARGIAYALIDAGVGKITILNRAPREFKAHALSEEISSYKSGVCTGGVLSDEYMKEILGDTDCIINTTPAGMNHVASQTPFDVSLLTPKHMVCDIVYKPHMTPLLSHAQEIGAPILEGYWMLVYQGVLAWSLWTGHKNAPVDIMAKVVQDSLE